MTNDRQIYRVEHCDREHFKQIINLICQSRKCLALKQPDTFLGHKTHEPFPEEEDRHGQGQ
ncbi:hypothetical protein ACVILK_000762 [Bradyrhizobium embrapense]